MKKFKDIFKATACGFSALLSALAFYSCSEDAIENPYISSGDYDADTQLVIALSVPEEDTDAPELSSRAESAPSSSEKQINDLRVLAFGDKGVVNRVLAAPSSLPVAPERGVATYEIKDLTPGAYNVYIVANLGERLADIVSENELKQVLLDYSSNLPVPGNLPMVYVPEGKIEIKGAGKANAPILEATMTIAAVKVKYSIVFDPSLNSSVFGGAGLKITDANISNVPKTEYVVPNAEFTRPELRTVSAKGQYFSSFTETPGNASANNKDIVETTGNGLASLDAYSNRYVWTGTVYLPERFAENGAAATTLEINGVVTAAGSAQDGNVRNKYSIILSDYEGGTAGDRSMPRGTYYEVVGHVKTLGEAELDASVMAKPWLLNDISTDFVHTFLNVSETKLKITSLENASLKYDTDGSGGAKFECETKVQSKDIINATIDASTKTITFSVNPSVDITTLDEKSTKGTAACYIKAGNIRKRIDVEYDIMPFFTITNQTVKIQFATSRATMNVKEYEYVTNLGGVIMYDQGNKSTVKLGYNGSTVLKSFTQTQGNSTIRVECSDPTAATGTITVTATTNPITTTQFFYDFYPQAARTNTKYNSYLVNGTVTVMPPLGDYRIYFRAINDWHTYEGGESQFSGEWLDGNNSMGNYYPTEGGSNNWIDYWYCSWHDEWDKAGGNGRYSQPDAKSHRIYIWTQEGETTSSDVSNNKVWRFTKMYNNGTLMTPDTYNTGWYYYDLSPTTPGAKQNEDVKMTPEKTPEPGTTLMIFNNHTNSGLGYSVHRATHHLDPGIPLFDFEDREGWVVYDPTMDPYYRMYDEKPVVEDVVYTVWSDVKPLGWYRKYGVAENTVGNSNNIKQFTVWSNNVTDVSQQSGYYKYQIRMKAVKGDYEKAIRVKFTGVTDGSQTTVPGYGNYIYYYYKASSGKGWNNPKIYLYNGSSNTGWGSFISPIDSQSADEGVYYRFEVPAAYVNGRVIFVNGSNTSQQFPTSGQDGLPIENKNKVYYSDSNSNNQNDYWKTYGQQPSGSSTVTSGEEGFILFNGRAYPGNEGYFNSKTKTWTSGKPF